MRHNMPSNSKLDRIDELCTLLRPWLNNTLERRGLTKRDDNHRHDQGLTYENSPNRPGRVTDLSGLDHIPGGINGFFNVEHRQRHGAGDP